MLREGGIADRYARTAWRVVTRDKWIAVGVFGFVVLFWFVLLPRDGGAGAVVKGESRDEHSQDVKSLENKFQAELARIATELQRDRRHDLQQLLEQRTQALALLKAEVASMKSLVDPQTDEERVQHLLGDSKPVDLQQYVVIPPLIHLTWKTKHLPYYGRSNLERWKELNPKHTIVVYDDDDIHKFVLKHFAEFEPHWKLLKPVQKADLFRYVVMWKLGGVYADIDVEPSQPIKAWMVNATSTIEWRTANVVLGWEQTTERKDWREFYASPMQLCQWTFASSPGHALWRAVMDSILRLYASGVPEPSIIRSTGPGMFSDAVKGFVRARYGAVFGEGQLAVKHLRERPVHVGDILVLTTKAFAGEGWSDGNERLVRHSFAGTWKTKEPSVEGGAGEDEKLDPLDSESGRLQHEMAKMRAEMRKARAEMDEEKSALQERIAILKKQRANAWLVDESGGKSKSEGGGGDGGGGDDETTTAATRRHRRRRPFEDESPPRMGRAKLGRHGNVDGQQWWQRKQAPVGRHRPADNDWRSLLAKREEAMASESQPLIDGDDAAATTTTTATTTTASTFADDNDATTSPTATSEPASAALSVPRVLRKRYGRPASDTASGGWGRAFARLEERGVDEATTTTTTLDADAEPTTAASRRAQRKHARPMAPFRAAALASGAGDEATTEPVADLRRELQVLRKRRGHARAATTAPAADVAPAAKAAAEAEADPDLEQLLQRLAARLHATTTATALMTTTEAATAEPRPGDASLEQLVQEYLRRRATTSEPGTTSAAATTTTTTTTAGTSTNAVSGDGGVAAANATAVAV